MSTQKETREAAEQTNIDITITIAIAIANGDPPEGHGTEDESRRNEQPLSPLCNCNSGRYALALQRAEGKKT